MVSEAVSNTGPILHLSEINLLNIMSLFSSVSIPEEVRNELRRYNINLPKKIKVKKISPKFKDTVKVLTSQSSLDLGEAEAITLSLQEKPNYFLTDDLEARSVARNYNLQVHGTAGIILRAFRERLLSKDA